MIGKRLLRNACIAAFFLCLLIFPFNLAAAQDSGGVGLPSDTPDQPIAKSQSDDQQPASPTGRAEEITVVGKRELKEEEPLGKYGQPGWTASPRFLTTSVYLVPAGVFEFDCWNNFKFDLSQKVEPVFGQQYEVEMGLGHRLQLDLYMGVEKIGRTGEIKISNQGIEMRVAFANWGRIWGNPTIYLDYENMSGRPAEGEAKLLLGGGMGHGWHWATNLIFERQLKKTDAAQEYTATFAFSYTVVDQIFSVGAEVQGNTEDDAEAERPFEFEEWSALAGPSLQWRPIPQMYIDVVALFGSERAEERQRPVAEPRLVAGWEFE